MGAKTLNSGEFIVPRAVRHDFLIWVTQIGALFALWGCAMQAGASNVATLLVGRIIGGFAIG